MLCEWVVVFRARKREVGIRDLILPALTLRGGEANATQLQKAVFVLAQELRGLGFRVPELFKPHLYGPYSTVVEEEAGKLYDEGVIEEERRRWDGYEKVYRLRGTPGVVERYRILLGGEWERLREEIGRIAKMRTDEVLEWVYNKWPDYAAKSRVAVPARRDIGIRVRVLDPDNPEDREILQREYYSDEGFDVVDLGVVELRPGEEREIVPGVKVKFDEKNPDRFIVLVEEIARKENPRDA